MNAKILLFAMLITALGSCTTAYKSGQTPDDVYYSPAQPREDDVKSDEKNDATTYRESDEDREIRLRIRDRRWRYDDDYYFSYEPYSYNRYVNYCYHPKGYYYYNDAKTRTRVTYYPRKFTFPNNNNTASAKINPKTGQPYPSTSAPTRTFRTSSGLGNVLRKVLTNSSSKTTKTTKTSDDNSSTPVRTFDNTKSNSSSNNSSSSSSSSSSSNSSSGNAPVRTFNK